MPPVRERRHLVAALVRASHPEPTVAVTAIATALAVASGAGPRAGWVAAALLSGQLSVGWSNDWIDAARDRGSRRADKPLVRGALGVALVRRAALFAALACVPLSLLMGVVAGLLHLLAVASAWAYNARLKAGALSWLPYAFSFGAVPSIVTLSLPASTGAFSSGRALMWAPWWASAGGALLGVGAHLCNVLPDIEADTAQGVRGLPHRLGPRRSAGLAALLLLAASVLLALGPGRPGAAAVAVLAVAAVVTLVGLVRARRAGSRAAFAAAIVVAVLAVALLISRGAALTAS